MHHACIYTYTCNDNQACIDMISSNRWQHEKKIAQPHHSFLIMYIHDKKAMIRKL